jgi:hypothetical protein
VDREWFNIRIRDLEEKLSRWDQFLIYLIWM